MTADSVQVAPTHYSWENYFQKGRWIAFWHQVDEIVRCQPRTVLEVGVGTGVVASILRQLGIDVTTVDFDPALNADRAGDVRSLPCSDREFDLVLCAQVLEHLPWADVPLALSELRRVSKRHVLVTVPQSGRDVRFTFRVPGPLPEVDLGIRLPSRQWHHFDGQHHWQVGARGTRPRALRKRIEQHFLVRREFVLPEFTFHRFFLLERRGAEGSPAGS